MIFIFYKHNAFHIPLPARDQMDGNRSTIRDMIEASRERQPEKPKRVYKKKNAAPVDGLQAFPGVAAPKDTPIMTVKSDNAPEKPKRVRKPAAVKEAKTPRVKKAAPVILGDTQKIQPNDAYEISGVTIITRKKREPKAEKVAKTPKTVKPAAPKAEKTPRAVTAAKPAKTKMADGLTYCVRCKKGVKCQGCKTENKVMKNGETRRVMSGNCPECDGKVMKFLPNQ
jgi:hypothetical protein